MMLTRPGQARQNVQRSEVSLRCRIVSQRQRFKGKSWRNPVLLALFSTCALVTFFPKPISLSSTASMDKPNSRASISQKANSSDLGGATRPQKGTSRKAISSLSQPIQQVAAHQASLSVNPDAGSAVMQVCHPLGGLGKLTQGHGGLTHQGRMYYAYDLASPIGTPVYAMRSGRVIGLYDRYPDTGGGRDRSNKFNYVYLEHDDGYRSVYVHLQHGFRKTLTLAIGDWVEVGDLIGLSGNSGWSGGPHLHIEVQEPGESPRRFTDTVPFAIATQCDPGYVAHS